MCVCVCVSVCVIWHSKRSYPIKYNQTKRNNTHQVLSIIIIKESKILFFISMCEKRILLSSFDCSVRNSYKQIFLSD